MPADPAAAQHVETWITGLPPEAVLLHLPSSSVGKLAGFFAPGEFADPEGRTIDAHVIRFDTGHAFLAVPESFLALSPSEADFLDRCTAELRKLVCTIVGVARVFAVVPGGLTLPRALLLLRASLAAQIQALNEGA